MVVESLHCVQGLAKVTGSWSHYGFASLKARKKHCYMAPGVQSNHTLNLFLLRPLIKMLFLVVPYGYVIVKVKKNSSGNDRNGCWSQKPLGIVVHQKAWSTHGPMSQEPSMIRKGASYQSINLSIYLSVYLSICLSICLSIYLHIYLST